METITISKTYSLKWQIKTLPFYKVSPCGKMFNCKTNTELRRIINGGSIGYCIAGKFTSLKELRKQLELIPKKEVLPF